MSSKILKKDKNIVTVEFTISQEDFKKAENKAYLKEKNNITVQGFRKGKAPKHIIEKKYGKGIFYDEALDIAIQELYPIVIKENNIDVIDTPKINIEKFEEGQEIIITAEVEVMPEVELCEYRGIEVEKTEINVTDEDVDAEIKMMQEKNSRIVEVTDRAVQNKDILIIDYEGFVDEEQFEGGTAENYSLEIGSNTFIPGFEEQLIGKQKDEEIEVKVTFPEEYHSEDLKGKEAIFKVKIHEIKEKELPLIDDEFAKDVSEFDTLQELKDDTRNNLLEKAKENEKLANNNNIVTKVVNDSKVDVPKVLIDREVDYLAQEYEQQFRMQGFAGKEMEGFLKTLVDQYKENAKTQAEFNVKADLVLFAIIEKEQIKATEEEFEVELSKLAVSYKIEEDKLESFKQNIIASSKKYIEESIQKRKIMDILIENAVLVKKQEKQEEQEEKEEK